MEEDPMDVVLLGDGRISRALEALLSRSCPELQLRRIALGQPMDLAGAELVFGALPGGVGPIALDAALEAGVDLVDVADLDTPVYARRAADVAARGIRVVHGAGLSPGLSSMIVGHALARGPCDAIDVMAGSLSSEPFYFPFLWCFEDMVAEFEGPSMQLLDGRLGPVPAWAGLRSERVDGIAAESYLAQSGFEELAEHPGLQRLSYRNLRPEGFHHFFRFLRAHGAFAAERIALTRDLLQARREANRSLAVVEVQRGVEVHRTWVEAQAEAGDPLNSMQRVTAAVAIELGRRVVSPDGEALPPGVYSAADLGRRPGWLESLLPALRQHDVRVETSFSPPPGGSRPS